MLRNAEQRARVAGWLALLLGASCAGPSAGGSASLGGVEWRLVEISGEPLAAGGPQPTLAFDANEGRVAGSAGCNRYFAGFVEGPEGGAFELGAIGATRRMCPPPEMELEGRFLGALAEIRRWQRTGDRLRLSGETASLVFGARAAP